MIKRKLAGVYGIQRLIRSIPAISHIGTASAASRFDESRRRFVTTVTAPLALML